MESTTPIPHSLAEFAWLALAAGLGYLAKQLPSLFRKRQSVAEAAKTEAETRQIDAKSEIDTGHMWMDLLKLSAQATLEAERLRNEKDFQFARAERLANELKIAETARELAERQLDRRLIRLGKNDTD